VDPANVVVSWAPVAQDINGSAVTIVGFKVIVEEDAEPLFPQGFARPVFSVHLPATATSVTVPKELWQVIHPINMKCWRSRRVVARHFPGLNLV
jgi:hypothetical protein